MNVPLVDVKAAYLRHKDAIDAAMRDVVESTAFIQGPHLRAFEEAFAAFCGTRHAIGVGSGTAALHLALAAAGVGAGDVVAVPAHSFIATIEPVSWLGAKPRFVEIDPQTGAMDPAALKNAIDGVRAVLPVHIHGRPADMEQIGAIAADAGVPVIEDAAQAHGAEITRADGSVVRAGGHALAGCFSFYPGKNLGAFGDAGAVTTNDDDFAAAVRRLRDHGRTSKYEHEIIGYAHRMDTLQAAVLHAKLGTLDADNQRRAELVADYVSALDGIGDLWFPPETPGRRSVYHHALVRTAHRDALLAFLKQRAIGAGVHYPVPLHLQPAYEFLGYQRGDLPATEAWADECLSLPLYPELTAAQHATVVAAVTDYFA
ncbi:DegT/DnrJ/EryC1/StrS family aminotransferase [Phytohabitans aurantiacus]|uniref:Glutamine--scyllo-inositol aminotransferase n=1 Tax=Phytohabitans aurantiacus TaxID=3016789 RepID=A0ABQ5R658_9ACTN|nr:DegT/DnrJ/EryC1/StrS family aminotransferase [Phytohabitans aurantiacus]GLI02036.1 glutamine--scyllo-inositol aminotransferase [Phytohabitans aurantiacus]